MRSLCVLSLVLLASCVETALPVTDGRINTRAEFLATAADRTVSNADTTVTITSDGRITGMTHGNEIAGNWEWRDSFWCRTITAPVDAGTDCQVWEISGNTLTITRAQGEGEQLVFVFGSPEG